MTAKDFAVFGEETFPSLIHHTMKKTSGCSYTEFVPKLLS
jgi:hypothetical protein